MFYVFIVIGIYSTYFLKLTRVLDEKQTRLDIKTRNFTSKNFLCQYTAIPNNINYTNYTNILNINYILASRSVLIIFLVHANSQSFAIDIPQGAIVES